MKQNIFKQWWSYLSEIHIESVSSQYNEELTVLLKNGRYQLCTPNAIYSYADKYNNFKDAFLQLHLEKRQISNVLLLGFGLGSIPFMLEKIFNQKYAYTGIEIDEDIIYLASKYVLDELTSEITLIHADASAFISLNTTKYDMICIDVFVDDKIPNIFLEKDFLEQVSENLTKNGIILYNHLAYTTKDKSLASAYFEKIFTPTLSNTECLKVNSNYVLVGGKKTF